MLAACRRADGLLCRFTGYDSAPGLAPGDTRAKRTGRRRRRATFPALATRRATTARRQDGKSSLFHVCPCSGGTFVVSDSRASGREAP